MFVVKVILTRTYVGRSMFICVNVCTQEFTLSNVSYTTSGHDFKWLPFQAPTIVHNFIYNNYNVVLRFSVFDKQK